MNKGIYRLVFSKRLGMLVPRAEIATAQGKTASGESSFSPLPQAGEGSVGRESHAAFHIKALVLFLAAAIGSPLVLANPTNPTVVSGSASFSQSGNSLTVTNTPNAIINWGSFSIGQSELTKFVQQSSASAVLNRVIGQNPSQILGQLQSNGRVFIINPNGVLFGQGARIDVAGLIASSLDISNADFLGGKLKFVGTGAEGAVKNAASITTSSGGQVMLIAPNVENSGVITSPNGEVILVAGHSVEITDTLNPAMRVVFTAPEGEAVNLGQMIADGGRIGMYAGLTTQSGSVSATSAVAEGGRIYLKGTQAVTLTEGSVTEANGTKGGEIRVIADERVNAHGILTANGGGFIETSAAVVDFTGAKVSAGQGGTWLIDPTDVTIDATAASTIVGSLDTGTNVIVQTMGVAGDGLGSGNITVSSAIAKTAGTDATLTLSAHNNIAVNANITSTSGLLNLNFYADSDTTGGGSATLASGKTINANGGRTTITGGFVLAGGAIRNTTLTTSANTSVTGVALLGANSVWNNTGTMDVSGYFSFASGSQLNNLSGGVVTLSGYYGHLALGSGSQFNNQAGGVVALSGLYAVPVLGAGSFDNAGTINKTTATGQTVSSVFNNTGTVNVNASTLTLSGNDIQAGTLNVASGAVLTLAGTQALNTGAAFSGAGNVNFGGAINLNAPVTFGSANPVLTLVSGSINGSATNVFTTTANTAVTGGVTLGANSVWNNTGTLDIGGTNGYLNLDSGSQLNNQAGGVVALSGLYAVPVLGAGSFDNAGTINKTSATGQTVSSVFNNTGSVHVTSGTLNLSNNGADTGIYDIDSGATLAFTGGTRSITANGITTFTGSDAIQGAGQVRFLGGTLTFSGAGSINSSTGIDLAVDSGPVVLGTITHSTNGNVADNGNGTLTYTPTGTYSGADSFTYQVGDGAGNFSIATVDISGVVPAASTSLPTTVEQAVAVVTNSISLGTVGVDTPIQYLSEDAPLLAALTGAGLPPTGAGADTSPDLVSSDTMTIEQVDSLIAQLIFDDKTEGGVNEEATRMVCR